MSKVIKYLPELEGEEQLVVAQIFKNLNEEQASQFANVYRQRRKDETTTLLTTLLAFLGVAGVNRFYLGQIGMGLAYLLTGGFCLIGTIIDIFNYKSLATKFNQGQALNVAELIRGAFPVSTSPQQLESASAGDEMTPGQEGPAVEGAGHPRADDQ